MSVHRRPATAAHHRHKAIFARAGGPAYRSATWAGRRATGPSSATLPRPVQALASPADQLIGEVRGEHQTLRPVRRPVTVAAITTRIAATTMLMIHRIQSTPRVASTPSAAAR